MLAGLHPFQNPRLGPILVSSGTGVLKSDASLVPLFYVWGEEGCVSFLARSG